MAAATGYGSWQPPQPQQQTSNERTIHMDDSEKSIAELIEMAERIANYGAGADTSRARIGHDEAGEMIKNGMVNIWETWHRIVAMFDKGLAYTIGAVWIPEGLLTGSDDIDEFLDEDGRYKCVLSSRQWFDENKLSEEEMHGIYTAIDIVIGITRAVRGEGHDPDSD